MLWVACTGDPAVDDSGASTPDTATAPPEWCMPPEPGLLQAMDQHPAGPYFVSHPMEATDDTPTVVFLPGSRGDAPSAETAWGLYFLHGTEIANVRVVLPFSDNSSLADETDRVLELIDEVLACYGGDRKKVHMAGTSNGGKAAYDLAKEHPERFVSLLGIPGSFSSWSPEELGDALADVPVYNGVGSEDHIWLEDVRKLHEGLLEGGVDATYAEFEGEAHVMSPDWDEDVLFDFWLAD